MNFGHSLYHLPRATTIIRSSMNACQQDLDLLVDKTIRLHKMSSTMLGNMSIALSLCFTFLFTCSSAWSTPRPVASRPSSPWSSAAWPPFGHPMPTPPSATCSNAALPPNAAEWNGWGGNIYNNHWAAKDTAINSDNIATLEEHCKIAYSNGG